VRCVFVVVDNLRYINKRGWLLYLHWAFYYTQKLYLIYSFQIGIKVLFWQNSSWILITIKLWPPLIFSSTLVALFAPTMLMPYPSSFIALITPLFFLRCQPLFQMLFNKLRRLFPWLLFLLSFSVFIKVVLLWSLSLILIKLFSWRWPIMNEFNEVDGFKIYVKWWYMKVLYVMIAENDAKLYGETSRNLLNLEIKKWTSGLSVSVLRLGP